MNAAARPQRTPQRTSGRTWLGLLPPAIVAFVILIGLGTWQVERKAWKEALIASLTERTNAAPTALPAAKDWTDLTADRDEYSHVKFTGQFDNAPEALVFGAASTFRPDVGGPGYWVFTPARLADGNTVIVNRGFIPEARKDPGARAAGQIAGPVEIVGTMRWPDSRHWFTPADDAGHNLFFLRDPASIAAAKHLGAVAPFYVEQEAPVPPGGLPKPGKLVIALPDNHLQYAITWYGLAAALVCVFVIWAWNSRRNPPREAAPPSL